MVFALGTLFLTQGRIDGSKVILQMEQKVNGSLLRKGNCHTRIGMRRIPQRSAMHWYHRLLLSLGSALWEIAGEYDNGEEQI